MAVSSISSPRVETVENDFQIFRFRMLEIAGDYSVCVSQIGDTHLTTK